MSKKRPINLDLSTMKFPIMAISSILHRVSGVVLFLGLPFILYLFGQSLHSEESFGQVQNLLTQPLYKLLLWAFCTALGFHLIAGIRHMIMDLGVGESLGAGRCSARLVIVLSIIFTIVLGIWIW